MKIGLFVFNIGGGGGVTSISNLISIFNNIFDDIYLITTIEKKESNPFKSNKFIFIPLVHPGNSNKYMKILNTFLTQLKMSYQLLRVFRNVNAFLFIGEILVLPMFIAKILRKSVIVSLPASHTQMNKFTKNNLYTELEVLTKISLKLADNILLYSPNLIDEWEMRKYQNKIKIVNEHFLNFETFKIHKDFDERENLIGYVGRLSAEKAPMNFLKSIKELSKENIKFKFLIIGNGELKEEMKLYIEENELYDIEFIEWVNHDELPVYLNKLKLLLIPSYTEGLPNIMIEAMACGTPVLATSVGSIPDFIKDGSTGFLMENNSPECISKNIISAINYSDIGLISERAYSMVKKEFSKENTIKKWSRLFTEI